MNPDRRKELARANAFIAQALTIIEVCAEDEREALSSLPDSLQDSDRAQAMDAVTCLSECQSHITEAVA